jgi:hypothetical protein
MLGKCRRIWDALVFPSEKSPMPNWEYKVITSGKGGFASPAMLEKFLNDLGKEEWEVIAFRTAPDNPLAFNGLARRSTQRDWTLEDAAATAAKAEADKVRAEFEAKFKGLASQGESIAGEESPNAVDDGYRSPVDTSRDQDPDAEDDEVDEWDQLSEEEELPTFFDAIKPHMRRNQRGAGQSVGVDCLAKKWGFEESDITGALKECGFSVPDDENAPPQYLEYDGDLYWVNINRRGEVWINTKEKPQPKFRVVAGQPVTVEEPEKKTVKEPAPKPEQKPAASKSKSESPTEPVQLPEGPALLDLIRPKMRRNRGDAGGSGSTSFLSRAFKCAEDDLLKAFAGLGLTLTDEGQEKPAPVEIGDESWWLNRDQRGGVWINGKPNSAAKGMTEAGESAADNAASAARSAPIEPTAGGDESLLVKLRASLKGTRTGASAAEVGQLAESAGQSADDLIAALVATGLKVPEKAREKPVFVELNGEIYWLNKNAKGQLWLNAKASKFADEDAGESKPKRSRSRKSAPAKADAE